MNKILIVEDDQGINSMLRILLTKNKYEVYSAFSGTEALLLMEREVFDVVLLDLMLPGLSGEEILAQITERFHTPVICVSAKDDMETKLNLIRQGADDFITKPFNNEELVVRIGALIRRINKENDKGTGTSFTFKDLVVDSDNHLVTIHGDVVDLTTKEYAILELLISNPKKVFTKQNIFESVWEEEYMMDERSVTVHVSNLRNKLKQGENYIKTVWGIGYKMQDK